VDLFVLGGASYHVYADRSEMFNMRINRKQEGSCCSNIKNCSFQILVLKSSSSWQSKFLYLMDRIVVKEISSSNVRFILPWSMKIHAATKKKLKKK
jgi:hypothetical protein